ncbi:MAG: hypothetical protein U0984_02260, partial [Prosthecobacter sp.]|nr:hypothetical protein [Prosthecobacter sp.]
MNAAEQWKLLEQWERARDGRLDDAEAQALSQRILHDPEARRFLAEAALMDAELRVGGEPVMAAPVVVSSRTAWRPRLTHGLTAIAAAIVAAGLVWVLVREPA